jgi:DNA invertase Pin-like site-specific DNA recombinase
MPKRKQRAAIYIRESDVTLADSTTIDSAVKACREYCKKEGYILEPQHEYKEAISAYSVPYFQRPRLMQMLEAASRHEFDVLVITEVRALSRKGAGEVFLIYEALQKASVNLETIHERFSDDPVGELVLSFKATYAKLEREQSQLRLQRGKADRIAIGNAANGNGKSAYGYILIDSEREVKAIYQFNTTIIYVDRYDRKWSELAVCLYIFDLLKEGVSLRKIAMNLNDLGIPTPQSAQRKGTPHWRECTIRFIATNRLYIGEVWANKFKRVGNTMVKRPKEEWIRMPDAPALIDVETFEEIQEQFTYNKQESIRNNRNPKNQLGLLRAGYCKCGICNGTMQVIPTDNRPGTFAYCCRRKTGGAHGIVKNHRTQIHMTLVDAAAREKIIESVNNPELVRAKVEELRKENKPPPISTEEVTLKLDDITHRMRNLYNLAENATDDKTMAELTERMRELEQKRRETEGLLYDIADEEEERANIEREIARFEKWAAEVRPNLNNPDYVPSYEELRLAIRILGLTVTVYPTQGGWPFRFKVDITIPKIMKEMKIVNKSSH